MTDQEIFDTVAKHLLTQKRKIKSKSYKAQQVIDNLRVGKTIPDSWTEI
jgi:hypothetical protein